MDECKTGFGCTHCSSCDIHMTTFAHLSYGGEQDPWRFTSTALVHTVQAVPSDSLPWCVPAEQMKRN